MLPISGKKIFSSRWWALAFAAGVLWTAVDVADREPRGDADANGADAAAQAFANIVNGM